MAMVVEANKKDAVGGHIASFASCATLYEIGFNHFFRGPDHPSGGDLIYYQGHSTPGIYARSYLEGRLTDTHLDNFRRELAEGGGLLLNYPHPWLMPDYWQFPTVSMGLGPIMAVYHARFLRVIWKHRGLKDTSQQKVWCFMGDGEGDEPESLGAISTKGFTCQWGSQYRASSSTTGKLHRCPRVWPRVVLPEPVAPRMEMRGPMVGLSCIWLWLPAMWRLPPHGWFLGLMLFFSPKHTLDIRRLCVFLSG